MGNQTLDNNAFERFVDSLATLINDLKKEHGSELIYTDDEGRNKYWNEVKNLIGEGESWLYSKLADGCDKLDRHKYSALLLVVLIKKPLFKSDATNKQVGYCLSSFIFAWKSALYMLSCFIQEDKNPRYAEYIKKNGVSIPSGNYFTETLRSFQISFRPFKKKGAAAMDDPPFKSMLADLRIGCSKEVWAFALLLANNFSLIEDYSKTRYECKALREAFRNKK